MSRQGRREDETRTAGERGDRGRGRRGWGGLAASAAGGREGGRRALRGKHPKSRTSPVPTHPLRGACRAQQPELLKHVGRQLAARAARVAARVPADLRAHVLQARGARGLCRGRRLLRGWAGGGRGLAVGRNGVPLPHTNRLPGTACRQLRERTCAAAACAAAACRARASFSCSTRL